MKQFKLALWQRTGPVPLTGFELLTFLSLNSIATETGKVYKNLKNNFDANSYFFILFWSWLSEWKFNIFILVISPRIPKKHFALL